MVTSLEKGYSSYLLLKLLRYLILLSVSTKKSFLFLSSYYVRKNIDQMTFLVTVNCKCDFYGLRRYVYPGINVPDYEMRAPCNYEASMDRSIDFSVLLFRIHIVI